MNFDKKSKTVNNCAFQMKEVFICYSNIFRQKNNLLSIDNTYKFFRILQTALPD